MDSKRRTVMVQETIGENMTETTSDVNGTKNNTIADEILRSKNLSRDSLLVTGLEAISENYEMTDILIEKTLKLEALKADEAATVNHHKLAVSAEKNEAGKATYSNEDARASAVAMALFGDTEWVVLQSRIEDVKRDISRIKSRMVANDQLLGLVKSFFRGQGE